MLALLKACLAYGFPCSRPPARTSKHQHHAMHPQYQLTHWLCCSTACLCARMQSWEGASMPQWPVSCLPDSCSESSGVCMHATGLALQHEVTLSDIW